MVVINLGKQEVDLHLSSSVSPDPEFIFWAYKSDHLLEARGTLTISRPGDPEKAIIFIDRRHLDSLITVLGNMRNKIDALEAGKTK